MKIIRLAWHNLWRYRQSFEVQILAISLIIAMTSSIAIACFGSRLHSAMNLRASEFLAADLVLESSTPISAEQQQLICNLSDNCNSQNPQTSKLKTAQVVEFASVITSDNAMLLVSAKAISANYPLRGKLKSALTIDGDELTQGIPVSGEVWVDHRILAMLNIELGAQITLGKQKFKIARILLTEPDNANDFYSLNPHLIFNVADLDATGIIAPGSRIKYRKLVAGDAKTLQLFQDHLQPTLHANQKIIDATKANNQISKALQRAQQYLSLATLLAIILAAVAVALSASRFASKRFDSSSLLRCLGLTHQQVICFFSAQLLLLGAIASIIAVIMGYCAQLGLFYLLRNLLPPYVPPPGITPFISGISTGLVALIGFSLPSIVALGRVPPLRVLRSDVMPHPLSSWLSYGVALVALALIMWNLALNVILTAALLAGGICASLVVGIPLLLALKKLRKITAKASLTWRMSLGQLLRYPFLTCGQILAFAFIFTAMALIFLLRTELLNDWQKQLPPNVPNHFALNITSHELPDFKEQLTTHSAYQSPFYPITMGRITAINGQKVTELNNQDQSLKRDLSLTFSANLPQDNLITKGDWWHTNSVPNMVQISVEQDLAKRLKVELNDTLTFHIAGQNITAQIVSLRKVNWENFEPNFFVIFNPSSLNNCADNSSANCIPIIKTLAVTYLVSFYLDLANSAQLLALSREFPTVTILSMTTLLEQLRSILAQVTLATEAVLFFVLAAGIMVLLAGLQTTLDDRQKGSALLRSLGAPRILLHKIRLCEFALLGAISGLVAIISCEIVGFALYRFQFNLMWSFHPQLWLLPLCGAFLVSLIGILGSLRITKVSPLQVLREC